MVVVFTFKDLPSSFPPPLPPKARLPTKPRIILCRPPSLDGSPPGPVVRSILLPLSADQRNGFLSEEGPPPFRYSGSQPSPPSETPQTLPSSSANPSVHCHFCDRNDFFGEGFSSFLSVPSSRSVPHGRPFSMPLTLPANLSATSSPFLSFPVERKSLASCPPLTLPSSRVPRS